jgi:hypothetical protein
MDVQFLNPNCLVFHLSSFFNFFFRSSSFLIFISYLAIATLADGYENAVEHLAARVAPKNLECLDACTSAFHKACFNFGIEECVKTQTQRKKKEKKRKKGKRVRRQKRRMRSNV